ncbi:MAG: hypothetical protein ACRDWE_01125 [Acidimicrobiales bacterium]
MSAGGIVWAAVGAAWLCWLVVSGASSRVPGVARVVRSFVGSWLGRYLALAAWAGAGWHLFCQRP